MKSGEHVLWDAYMATGPERSTWRAKLADLFDVPLRLINGTPFQVAEWQFALLREWFRRQP